MDLLPLEDETWVSIAAGPVHFAQAQGIDIPSDIDLRIISKKVANTDRLCLLKNLGVEPASVAIVRNKILERYSEQGSPTYIPLRASKHHLEFLYLTQKIKSEEEPSYMRLSIIGDMEKRVYRPLSESIFIAVEDDPYGPWELLEETIPGPAPGDGAQGSPTIFLTENI